MKRVQSQPCILLEIPLTTCSLIISPTYYHCTTTVFCIFKTLPLPHRGTSYHCGATVIFWGFFNFITPTSMVLTTTAQWYFFFFFQTKPLPHRGTFLVFFDSAVVKTEQKKEKTELFFFFYTQKIPRKKLKTNFFGEDTD